LAEKDLTSKSLESKADVFADIYNGLMHFTNEATRIDPEKLVDLPTESFYYDADDNIRNLYQDVFKRYGNQNFALACLGLENEAVVERLMPVRILGYVFANYKRQADDYNQHRKHLLKSRKDADTDEERAVIDKALARLEPFYLVPVIILVLNFSGKDWNEPISLNGLVRTDNPYKNNMVDHVIKVVNIHSLTPEDCKVFTSDFGPLVNFLNSKTRSFEGMEQKLDHPLEVLDMLNAYKGVDNYRKVRDNILMSSMKGVTISMGTLLDEMMDEAKKDRAYSIARNMLEKGKLSYEEIADYTGLTVEEVEELDE